MVDGVSGATVFDPTLGSGTPNPELYMEEIAARSLWGALERQNQTLRNASISAGIKKRLAKPINKQMTGLTKQIGKLDKQIARAKGKERDDLIQNREKLQAAFQSLDAQLKEVGKNDPRVKRLEYESRQLNTLNHASNLFYSRTGYMYSSFLDRYIRETDLLSQDIATSATQFAPPMGLFGMHFATGGTL